MGAGYGRAWHKDVKTGEKRHGLKRKRDDFDEDMEDTDDEQSVTGLDAGDDDGLHDGGLLALGHGGSKKEFALDAPRLKARSSDDMTITWRVYRDSRTRDVRDVTCYKVEMRSAYGDWVTPADSAVIVAPSELGQPFRDIKRKFLRDKTFVHPGTSVEIRVRAVRGPRRGLTSPALRTRFLDGPIEIWQPLPACLMDSARDADEATTGLRRVNVHSGATIGSLRETLKVANCERLVVAASRRAHAQLRSGRPTIEGVPIDHCSPNTKLRDIIELQPWHWSLGSAPSAIRADQPQQPQPRFVYTSPPGRTQDSFPVAIYLANPSKLQTSSPPALLKGEVLPFPCWLELSDCASVGDIKTKLLAFFAERGVNREASNLASLELDELLLYAPSGSQLEDEYVVGAHHPLAWGPTPTLLLDFKVPATFDLTLIDASNHMASVCVTDTTTLGDVARTLQLDGDAMTSILKLSLPQVNATTTLRALGFSSLFWLLHGGRRLHDGDEESDYRCSYHIGVGMQGTEQSRKAAEYYAKVTVEVFPDVITDDTRIFRIQADTSLHTLERLVQTAFWHLRPTYDVRLETSLRRRPSQNPVSMHLSLRGLSDVEVPGGGQGYCLRAIARPSEWRDERAQ